MAIAESQLSTRFHLREQWKRNQAAKPVAIVTFVTSFLGAIALESLGQIRHIRGRLLAVQ